MNPANRARARNDNNVARVTVLSRLRVLASTILAAALLVSSVGVASHVAHAAPPNGPVPSVYQPLRTTAPVPTTTGLTKALQGLVSGKSLGKFSMVVVDPVTEQTLFSDTPGKARIPASVTKVMTAAAVLSALGPQYRVVTSTKKSGSSLYLVGGGDPLMPRAKGMNSLKELAQRTARELKSQGVRQVSVLFDASLFSGPKLGPGWKSSYPAVGVAAPVSALTVGGARTSPGAITRVKNPARQTAWLFAKRLRNQGITVTAIAKGQTPTSATPVASVQSASMGEVVERMLRDSDNDAAEILAHLVGVKVNGEGSFASGARATIATLKRSGINVDRLSLSDGSGLSSQNKVTGETVSQILTDMVRGDEPAWASIAAGLPVAGKTGTLKDRFNSRGTKAGAGVVRAKTGSLTGVSALAGTVLDRSGRLLVFTMMANGVNSIYSARDSIDRIATKIAKCGCS